MGGKIIVESGPQTCLVFESGTKTCLVFESGSENWEIVNDDVFKMKMLFI